jgi:uncharacterized PurR-regulated membrane protein YhhQ (DUF165 family)
MSFQDAFALAAVKYVFKAFIAFIDTIFIYLIRNWDVSEKES